MITNTKLHIAGTLSNRRVLSSLCLNQHLPANTTPHLPGEAGILEAKVGKYSGLTEPSDNRGKVSKSSREESDSPAIINYIFKHLLNM